MNITTLTLDLKNLQGKPKLEDLLWWSCLYVQEHFFPYQEKWLLWLHVWAGIDS